MTPPGAARWFEELALAQKRGEAVGLPSICSSHPDVLRAACRRAAVGQRAVLIEATCNQVNQYGGYSGLTPTGFRDLALEVAAREGLPAENLLLGGDHLGPSVWRTEPEAEAMDQARTLVQDYVRAGFIKIHLDASMPLGDDDPTRALAPEVVAARAARLAAAAEEAWGGDPGRPAPRYVIGTEVPPPGGAIHRQEVPRITPVSEVRDTLEISRRCFGEAGIEHAWERVIAVVVQPGVEFGDNFVVDYDPLIARGLSQFVEQEPRLVYEAHSTDYQQRSSLRDLVRDHFAILKVGPALTFAFREMVFALAMMEEEMLAGRPEAERSHLVDVIDEAMRRQPAHWQGYYRGSPGAQAFARKFSLSDRIRYYWPQADVRAALECLMRNLGSIPPPLALLSQHAPRQFARIREGVLENTPRALILDHIGLVLDDYDAACLPGGSQAFES